MGNRQICWLGSLGILLVLSGTGARLSAQESSAGSAPQTIYRIPSGSGSPSPQPTAAATTSEWVQQTEPQATLTRSPQTPGPSEILEEAANDSVSPVFQLDLRRQDASSPAQGAGPAGAGSEGQGTSAAAGSGGTVGSDGAEGAVSGPAGVGTPGTSGSGTGSGWASSEAVSAQRYPETTGVIVDARGLDFQPSMSMRLFDPEGNQVYTTPGANQDLNAYLVASSGTAAYVSTEEQARALVQRIGERPYQIRAIKTLGYDLVISNEDAWTLRQRNQVDQFLDNYAVVVIWDYAS